MQQAARKGDDELVIKNRTFKVLAPPREHVYSLCTAVFKKAYAVVVRRCVRVNCDTSKPLQLIE